MGGGMGGMGRGMMPMAMPMQMNHHEPFRRSQRGGNQRNYSRKSGMKQQRHLPPASKLSEDKLEPFIEKSLEMARDHMQALSL